MKKFLLSLLLVASVISVFAQTPCVSGYQINNGGGNCPPDVNGSSATGSVTLSFEGTINPLNIPSIVNVTDITDPGNPVLVTGITFGPGTLLNTGNVRYCYYIGPNNNNNLQGQNAQFLFTISYNPGVCTQIILPVSFRSFTALRNNSAVALKWTTASESNNLGFEIQRLIGNSGWQKVAFVATQAQAGSSNSLLSYQYNDINNTKGISQYRIRQVDLDSRSRLSEIRAVRGEGQPGKTIVYPNPSNDGRVTVVFEDRNATRDISVMDMSGRIVKQLKGITNNNIQIDNLTPGIYSLRVVVVETGAQVVEKVVVNKR